MIHGLSKDNLADHNYYVNLMTWSTLCDRCYALDLDSQERDKCYNSKDHMAYHVKFYLYWLRDHLGNYWVW